MDWQVVWFPPSGPKVTSDAGAFLGTVVITMVPDLSARLRLTRLAEQLHAHAEEEAAVFLRRASLLGAVEHACIVAGKLDDASVGEEFARLMNEALRKTVERAALCPDSGGVAGTPFRPMFAKRRRLSGGRVERTVTVFGGSADITYNRAEDREFFVRNDALEQLHCVLGCQDSPVQDESSVDVVAFDVTTRRLRFVLRDPSDSSDESFEMCLSPSGEDSSVTLLRSSLPVTESSVTPPARFASFPALLTALRQSVKLSEAVRKELADLDSHCTVLSLTAPRQRCSSTRRIVVLREDLYADIRLSVREPRCLPVVGFGIAFSGTARAVREATHQFKEQKHLWQISLPVRQNLETVLQLSIPANDSTLLEATKRECGICHEFLLEGSVPTVFCACSAHFHAECLREWFLQSQRRGIGANAFLDNTARIHVIQVASAMRLVMHTAEGSDLCGSCPWCRQTCTLPESRDAIATPKLK
ncbi:MAG: hypothetical protein MHM6MM_002848 [Cercozoa sp. M6MM]